MRLKELRESAQSQAATIRQMADKINAEGRDFTAEENEAWTKVNADYNRTKAELEQFASRQKIMEQADAAQEFAARFRDFDVGRVSGVPRESEDAAVITDEIRATAFAAWGRSQYGLDLTEKQARACKMVGLNPNVKNLHFPLYSTGDSESLRSQFTAGHHSQALARCRSFKGVEFGAATMSSATGASGGYLVPPETFLRTLEVNMLAFGGVRQVAAAMRTASGERMSWPTFDDTANTGTMIGESVSTGAASNPSAGKIFWDAYKFSTGVLLVPYELLQDSAFDLASVLAQALGMRLGRITATKHTTGTGANEPKGIVTCASLGVTAASATAIAADELYNLQHSVDPAYRPGSGWMFHDNVLLAIRKLKDSTNQYLWQSNIQNGAPDTLLGSPITISMEMASAITTGQKTILYGQLSAHKIRTVGDIRLYRLEERYRDSDQDGFVALLREDSNMVNAGTAPVKYLVQA